MQGSPMSACGRRRSDRLTVLGAEVFFVVVVLICCSVDASAAAFKSNSIVDTFSALQDARSRNCVDKPLPVRERAADAVFSGTVRDLAPDTETATWRARVAVKRVVKGADVLRDAVESRDGQGLDIVWVRGLGHPGICFSLAKRHDSWIFLTKRVHQGPGGNAVDELWLNSSLVRLTLYNIDHADAVVQNKEFTTTASIPADPCAFKFCPFWSQCFFDASTGAAECRCSEKCSSAFAPVCGTDNVTYTNDCLMKASSCAQNKRIVVAYSGSCDVRDPCAGKSCSFGARCVASLDGLVARCQCPETCAAYGDSIDSGTVCGSDGIDYANLCELRKAACRLMKEITKKYDGKCDPCAEVNCGQQSCQLSTSRSPECKCGAHLCHTEFRPVCGTDGRTYISECFLRNEACRRRTNIEVLHSNDCRNGYNPCRRLLCSPHQECRATRQSQHAQCVCPDTPCEPIVRLLCGSNDVTYDSECEMIKDGCRRKMLLSVKSFGACTKGGPCDRASCRPNQVCVVEHRRARCICPSCTEEFQPVCGANGVTYPNECRLTAENCEKESNVGIKYRGLCSNCETKKCEFYSICEDDGKSGPQCVCPTGCVEVDRKVCGSDGVTYRNECEMKVASCQKQQFILIQSEGSCDSCAGVTCRHGARCENGKCVCSIHCPELPSESETICASNGETYPSECSMRLAACQLSRDLEVEAPGPCDDVSGSGDICDEMTCKYGGLCKFDNNGVPSCFCNFSCDAVRSSVCGSDGKIYSNECSMREESCKRQIEITAQPTDNCGDLSEELCDGRQPLTNPTTGREYDCDDGRDRCPTGSYCHKTTIELPIARCCPEELPLPLSTCEKSEFGCCSDGRTSAPGPNRTGCPSFCQCNPIGSLGLTCDPVTRQCTCKPGVGGVRCDRCEPGYWGLPKIADGNSGCTPCGCNLLGSVRDDCEQMTGRCMCRPGITGQKCSLCTNGKELITQSACSDEMMMSDQAVLPKYCSELRCQYGSSCVKDTTGVPRCMCSTTECRDVSNTSLTCGTDGQTYGSPCQLQQFACRRQRNIKAAFDGPCSAKTAQDMDAVEGLLGDICGDDDDCEVDGSRCNGVCVCQSHLVASTDNNIWFCKVRSTLAVPTTSSTTPRPVRRTPPPIVSLTTWTPRPRVSTQKTTMRTTTPTTTVPTTTTTIPTTTRATTTTTTPTPTTTKRPKPTTTIPITTPKTVQLLSTSAAKVDDGQTSITIPQFDGNSILEIPLKKRIGKSLMYEIWLFASGPNGVVLYASQLGTAKGDYLSLVLVDGYLQLRYDLGSGPARIVSADKLPLETWHKVVISRTDRDGSLRINGNDAVTGSSKGGAKELNLQMKLYIGGFVGESNAESGVAAAGGFVGAIQRIYENGTLVENLVGSALKVTEVTEYIGPPCQSASGRDVCQNGGTCTPSLNTYQCVCVPPYVGTNCASTSAVTVDSDAPLHFDGSTHHWYNNGISAKQGNQRNNRYEIQFQTSSNSGVLLIQNKGATVSFDYLVIVIVDGYVEAGYNLGKQSSKNLFAVRSLDTVNDGQWHTIILDRKGITCSLSVDDGVAVTGTSAAGASDLNTDTALWLGGKSDLPTGLPSSYYAGFNGCIASVVIDGKPLHLVNNRKNTLPPPSFCSSSPDSNGS